MTKVLITGGAGFIGSCFVKLMAASHPDWLFVNLDALTYAGNLENLKELENNPHHIFVKGDITDASLIQPLFAQYGFDYVVNFAAESHVDRSIREPEAFVKTNLLGTHCLLEAARKSWDIGEGALRQGVKFLQVSTDEVYGALGSTGRFTEDSLLKPSSPYSASKAGADLLVHAYVSTFGMPCCITRSSNNFGPFQFPEKLIPLMISNAIEGKPLPVYGDGLQVRDWIYVEDNCRAIEAVLLGGAAGEVYNIGGGNERTNLDIIKLILNKLGRPESLIAHIKDRPGHDRRYALDCGKIKAALGWKPRFTFEIAVDSTIDWYLANSQWLSSVRSGAYMDYYRQYYGG